jgi:hypothetical protein
MSAYPNNPSYIDGAPARNSLYPQIHLEVSTPPADLPPFHATINSLTEKQASSPGTRRKANSNNANANRALNESRKLLAHLLARLQRRAMPPPTVDELKRTLGISSGRALGAIVDTARAAVKWKNAMPEAGIQSSPAADEDDDGDEQAAFTTDFTYELMMQLKDVLGESHDRVQDTLATSAYLHLQLSP